MGKYGISFAAFNTDASNQTVMAVVAGTGEESEIVEIIVTGDGVTTAADRQHTAAGAFYDGTAAGTGTATTPELFDQRGNAAKMTGTTVFTVEPTVYNTVHPVRFGFNQRGGMRWAVPQGEGIKVRGDDTEDNFGVRVDSDAAGHVEGALHFWEP